MQKKQLVRSFVAKLLASFILVSLGVIVFTMGPALYLFSKTMQAVNEDSAQHGVQGLRIVLEDYKESALRQALLISENKAVVNAIESREPKAVLAALTPLVSAGKLDLATAVDSRGVVLARTHLPEKRGDSAGSVQLKKALGGAASAGLEPGGDLRLAALASAPVKNANGEIIGAISLGYDTEKNSAVDHAKALFGTDATIFLSDVRIATTIIQDGKRVVGTKLTETIAKKVLQEGQAYTGEAEILGTPYITTYIPLMGPENKPIGVLFAGEKRSDALAARNQLIYTVGSMAAIVLIVTALVALLLARKISKPIKELTKTAGLVANGDLTLAVPVTSNDEIGELASDFNQMTSKLKDLISGINGLAQSVAASAQELNANADQSAQAADQVAASIVDVAHGAQQQMSAISHTSATAQEITASIQHVAGNAESVAAASAKTLQAAKDGGNQVETAVTQIARIEVIVTQSSAKVGRLGQRSDEIGRFVDTISSIAAQTNLLALNAAIEAARAGEAGRGFSVVAEEVRQLAEESQRAAKQISVLVGEIQAETKAAVEAMKEGAEQVAVGSTVVNRAGASFQSIVALIDKVTGQVHDISAEIQQIAYASKEIVTSVQAIDEISRHASAEAQTVSAATEEQSASMQEIASASNSLAQLAQQMQDALTRFRL